MKSLLKILLKFYHLINDFRLIFYQAGIFKTFKVNSKVISIGNISFGGTGKTPITIKIAKNLTQKNYKVAILLRGYKRKNESTTKIVYNGVKFLSNVKEAGDEPYLIALKTKCPVVVSKDRVKGAKIIIEKFNPDFIILDDAYQHLKIFRDKDIVLIKQNEFSENYLYFRESFKNLNRADVIIITKIYDYEKLKNNIMKIRNYSKAPTYLAEFKITGFKDLNANEILSINNFKSKDVVLFCGIAYPEFLLNQLKKSGFEIVKFFKFKDHVDYSDSFYKKLNEFKNYTFITTEKDEVKINKKRIKNFQIYSVLLDINFTEFSFLKR